MVVRLAKPMLMEIVSIGRALTSFQNAAKYVMKKNKAFGKSFQFAELTDFFPSIF